jgi:hypothetical protein
MQENRKVILKNKKKRLHHIAKKAMVGNVGKDKDSNRAEMRTPPWSPNQERWRYKPNPPWRPKENFEG